MIYEATMYMVLIGAGALFTYGNLLLFRPVLVTMRLRLAAGERHAQRLRKRREKESDEGQYYRKIAGWKGIYRKLDLVLRTIQAGNYRAGAVERFIVLAISSALIVAVLIYHMTTALSFSALFSLFILSLWCIIPALRLRHIQIQAGYDLAEAIGILSSKYKLTRGSMRLALRYAAGEIPSPTIRRMFLHIVREEMNYVEPIELEKAVEELVFGIQTSFAKQLGLTILKGLLRGENVERTLMSIDKNIHKQMDLLRDEGDSSGEIMQLSWLHVILFPLLLVMMIVFMGWNSTVHYQFQTEDGRFWFVVVVSFIATSLLMASWFRRPPNDY